MTYYFFSRMRELIVDEEPKTSTNKIMVINHVNHVDGLYLKTNKFYAEYQYKV